MTHRKAPQSVGEAAAPSVSSNRETRWTLVLKACAGSSEAIEELSKAYWPAVYAFLRRRGFGPEDAEDLTQQTLARLARAEGLASVDPSKGRFRTFLFACAEHEASHFHERNGAAKRSTKLLSSLDALEAEQSYALLPVTEAPTEQVFDRSWSKIVVARALAGLKSEYERLGKDRIFEVLLPLLNTGTERGEFRPLAEKLEITEVNTRVTWMRFKASFVERMRREVAETVADPGEVDAELRHLMSAWLSTTT